MNPNQTQEGSFLYGLFKQPLLGSFELLGSLYAAQDDDNNNNNCMDMHNMICTLALSGSVSNPAVGKKKDPLVDKVFVLISLFHLFLN